MATITITVPNSGAIVNTVVALARERYQIDVPGGPTLTNIEVATWYTRELLRDAYIERQQQIAASAAQTTAAAAAAQAVTDATTSIT